MRYPNAFSGIKKIWLAEILMLIAAVMGIVLIVILALNVSMDGDAVVVSDAVLGAVGAITIVAALIALVAFILNLVGLVAARKDDEAFKTALLVTLLGIAASIISSVWSKSVRLVKVMDVVTSLCNLFASYYVLTGIANLADTYPDADTKALALKSRNLIMYTFCATAIIKAIIAIFNIQDGSTISTILGFIALAVEIVSYVLYLRALSKGKDMLAR